jgi:hypothetical protein
MSTHYLAVSESFVAGGVALSFVDSGGRMTGVSPEPEQAVEIARVLNRKYGAPVLKEHLGPQRVDALLNASAALSPVASSADMLPVAEWLLIGAPADRV